jgi:hypothetical protein
MQFLSGWSIGRFTVFCSISFANGAMRWPMHFKVLWQFFSAKNLALVTLELHEKFLSNSLAFAMDVQETIKVESM